MYEISVKKLRLEYDCTNILSNNDGAVYVRFFHAFAFQSSIEKPGNH